MRAFARSAVSPSKADQKVLNNSLVILCALRAFSETSVVIQTYLTPSPHVRNNVHQENPDVHHQNPGVYQFNSTLPSRFRILVSVKKHLCLT